MTLDSSASKMVDFPAVKSRYVSSLRLRRVLVFLYDLSAIGLAFTGAFLLRFDFVIPEDQKTNLLLGLPWIYLVQESIFISQGLYRGLWSFASVRDLYLIIRAVFLGTIISVAVLAITEHRLVGWPRSVFLLNPVLLILILGGGRFTYRFLREAIWPGIGRNKRILVIGAGQSANLIARQFSIRSELRAKVIGFLDDNPRLSNVRIQGSPVLGTLKDLPALMAARRADELIIAIPSLPGSKLRQILEAARESQTPCRICPPLNDVLLGRVELSQLREVRVEDLLRREPVRVDEFALQGSIAGHRILITGAGGSIGSELCRQVLRYKPAALILYDQSEFNLYRFEQELRTASRDLATGTTELVFVVGDVLDERKLRHVFETHKPQVVLHAAAYKHVPLMEENIYEAIQNNVCGTYQVLRAAASHGVRSFILISTDKAVRPTSVMGASKRMAELLAHSISSKYGLKTTAVRFGNVLDSEGSVLPLFREQIAAGGPITVTHPEITRYFMTIPEASVLVLQASLLGSGGEVFLLDMGEPVRIRELAEELIKLSGLKPYEDIEIVFTGLRKGEKLFEELLIDLKHAQKTTHSKIMVSTEEIQGNLSFDWEDRIQRFLAYPGMPSNDELLEWIRAWVPEYTATPNLLAPPEGPVLEQDPALTPGSESKLLH